MKTENTMDEMQERKVYASPAIVHELELETRAGSPLGMPDEFDSLGFGE